MTRREYCFKTGVKKWKLVKIIQLLMCGFKYSTINEQMNIGVSMIIDIEKLFVGYRPPIETVLTYRSQPYYENEQQMIIQDYNGSDLTGWELDVFNSKK